MQTIHSMHVDARRHLEGRLLPRRRPADRRAHARPHPAGGDGLARPAADRRHGRRRSADQQGGDRVASERPGIDVDYLFCQVWVDKAEVSDAAELRQHPRRRGAVRHRARPGAGGDPETKVRIFMVNSNQTVVATVQTPGGSRV